MPLLHRSVMVSSNTLFVSKSFLFFFFFFTFFFFLCVCVRVVQEKSSPKSATGISIVYKGKVLYMNSGGTIDATIQQKPDENTVFSVGSLTKMFTTRLFPSLTSSFPLPVDVFSLLTFVACNSDDGNA